MSDGVVPGIFEGLPKYVSTPSSVTRSSPMFYLAATTFLFFYFSISQLLEGQFISVCN